ncbi:MAG TPA: ABC-2 family transporter protein [Candidatus Udaeobacter sp.]|jgi:ABC-2 type transport system permease protein|nr:ABC-2 family transporter protein [Candidatus Udaeobacter sp.]
MVSSIRHYASVAACFARLAIQRQLEYPLFLFSWLLMIPIQYFSGIWMLKIIVDRFQPLNGWDFPELTFLYGLGLISHGIFVVFFINTWHIDHMVIDGQFDRLLLRPMNVFFQLVASYVNFIGLIDCIPGIIIFIYGCQLVGFEWTFFNVIKFLLVLAGGVFIRAALFITLGTIAFWTKRNASMVGFALGMLERGTMYPLTIYPHIIQTLFTFVIPIGFISFYPAAQFLGKSSDGLQLPLSFALMTPAIGMVCFFLSQWIFRIGMKSYESAGS